MKPIKVTTVVGKKGMIYIPHTIMDQLQIPEGSAIRFEVHPNGTLQVIPEFSYEFDK